MTSKTDENYGKGEATIGTADSFDPILKDIRLKVKEVLSAADFDIPLLPVAATKILELANKPLAGFDQIEELIKTDQVIAAKLIKMANSPYYRGLEETVALRDAMSRLGLKQLKDLVFSLSVQSKVFKVKGYEDVMKDLWDQSIACSAIAQLVAAKANINNDFAFVAGLLHNIGKPVLVNIIAGLEADRKKKEPNVPDLLGIKDVLIPLVFHEYYAPVGALVAAKWKLPEGVVETIRFHRTPEKATRDLSMCLIVHAANIIYRHFGYGCEEQTVILDHAKVFQALKINSDQIKKLEDEVPPLVESLLGASA